MGRRRAIACPRSRGPSRRAFVGFAPAIPSLKHPARGTVLCRRFSGLRPIVIYNFSRVKGFYGGFCRPSQFQMDDVQGRTVRARGRLAAAPTAYPKVRLIFCRARCPQRAVPGRPGVPPLRNAGIFRFGRRGRRPRRPAGAHCAPLRLKQTALITRTIPLIRLACGQPPYPFWPSAISLSPLSRYARHLPLIRGIGPLTGGIGLPPRVAPAAGTTPGALVRQSQAQLWSRSSDNFCIPRAQWPGLNSGMPLHFLRAGNSIPGQRDNPRNGGPGVSRHGERSSPLRHPPAILWFLSHRWERNSPRRAKPCEAARPKKGNLKPTPSSAPFGGHLSLSPLSLCDISP